MGSATLSRWPWDNLGSFKYLLYGPVVAKVLHSRVYEETPRDGWCLCVLILWVLRALVHQMWSCYVNLLWISRTRQIVRQGIDFKQIDREWHWDNFLILQMMIASMSCLLFPSLEKLPLWNIGGFISILVLHVTLSEPLYYWAHRCFHSNSYLFTHYHFLHHASTVLHPFTSGHATLLEHLVLSMVIGIPILGACVLGYGSITSICAYVLVFDYLRCLGHSNVEMVPYQLFDALPLFKYLIYTPTYYAIHNKEMNCNFCLFMPLYDALFYTLNIESWKQQKENNSGKKSRVPEFVFLAHGVDVISSLHGPFMFRSLTSLPYTTRLIWLPFWPGALILMFVVWVWADVIVLCYYNIRGRLHETWVVPRYGFQYFLPFAKKGINEKIESAILRADKTGVKVISLAALNKNEELNGGGTLFVNKHPNLRVRVVHGNTLTAAVILHELPKDVEEVFLTGATSKLGRAIALYLSRKKVRVIMLTLSTERFQKIQKEAPVEYQKYLVQATKYNVAENCKTWIVGKWITPSEQRWAPKGTHFHQFVVPPILSFRRDCTYGELAAMRLPKDVEGLGYCEYTMERGVVHACHAGGIVHAMEGWTHHEVGAIDVDRIDVVWKAALRQGLTPVSDDDHHSI